VSLGLLHFARQRFIDKCHRLGLAVDYWVINDSSIARSLVKMGADGIISDFPGVMVKTLK